MMTHRLHLRLVVLIIAMLALSACAQVPLPITRLPSTSSAPSGPTGADRVQLLVFPDDDEQILLDRIASARQRVYMTIYLLTDDRVIDALKTAKSNGADVRVLLEPHPYMNDNSAYDARAKLVKAGITIKSSNPLFRFTHQKSFVIDNTAVILTANMTRSALTRNREFGIVDTNPANVAEMSAAFDADWNRRVFTPTSPSLVWSPSNSRERIDMVINNAKQTLIVYAEVTQDDDQTQHLIAAAQRGVDVRLLVSPASSASDDSNATDLDRMQRSGVKVRYLKNPYVHAKLFIADGAISDDAISDGALGFTGSVNISTTSLEFNRELGILIQDSAALARMSETFNTDWNKAVER